MSAIKTSAAQNQSAQVKSKKLTKFLASSALTVASLIALGAPAHADNWTDHTILDGSTTVDVSIPNTTNITQNTSFVKAQGSGDINAGWTVNVAQPSNSAKYVLYDVTGDATQLMGALNANGEIYIFNQQGIIFGANSSVNVGSIVTSTGNISDANIRAGNLVFENVDTGSSIVLNGSVTVAEAGLAAFVAPQVINNGIITAKLGKVAMASGSKVTLDLYGDNLIEIAVDDKATDGLIKNSGIINAEGGVVAMSVQTAKAAVDDAINMGGVVNASSATVQGGKIVLSGGKSGVVKVAGKLDASGEIGGTVKVTGENIHVTEEAEAYADGGVFGHGGDVRYIAQNGLVYSGRTYARGGLVSGNGGFVDTSGHGWIDVFGSVDARAYAGLAGEWLIDPRSIEVTPSTDDDMDASGVNPRVFESDGNNSRISDDTIEFSLNNGTSVTLRTTGGGSSSSESGDITVNAEINKTGGGNATLRMEAHDDIIVNQNIISTVGALAVELLAGYFDGSNTNTDNNVTINANITTNGGNVLAQADNSITLNAGKTVATKGGTVTMLADGGDITLHGAINTTNGGSGGAVSLDSADDVIINSGITTNGAMASFTANDEFIVNGAGSVNTSNGAINVFANEVDLNNAAGQRLNAGTGTITVARESDGSIGLGSAAGGLQITQNELNKMTAGALVIGQTAASGNDEAINVENADFTRFNSTTLNTKRDDGSSGEDIQFSGNNQSKVLIVNADDDISFAAGTTLDADGDVTFNANTNNMSVGNLRLNNGSEIYTNGGNFLARGIDISFETGATQNIVQTGGGDFDLLATGDIKIIKSQITTGGGNVNIDADGTSGQTVNVENSKIDTTGGVTFGGIFLWENGVLLTGSYNSLADQFGNNNVFRANTAGGTITITGKKISPNNNNCFLAGGLACVRATDLVITADNLSKIYGDTDPLLTYTLNSGSLNVGDSFTGALVRAAGEDVGSYAITVGTLSVTNIGDYNIVFNNGTFTISKADLVVTANNDSKTYDGLAYSGGNGVTYSGFKFGQDETALGGALIYGGSSQGAVNAGSYVITAGGYTSGNYNISYNDGALTVGQATLTATVKNAFKFYNGLAYSGGNGVTYSGFVNGENAGVLDQSGLAYGGSSQGAVNAGAYDITASGVTAQNYIINTYNPGTLTVAKAFLIGLVNGDSKTYDGLAYSGGNGVNYLGFVNGENAGVLDQSGLAYGGSSQGAVNAGLYLITASGVTAQNYNILAYVPNLLAVNRARLEVTADPQSKFVGSADPTLTYAITNGTLFGKDAFTGGLVRDPGEALGPYAINRGTLSAGSNYRISYIGNVLTIVAAPVVASVDQELFFRDIAGFKPGNGRLDLTITGLPTVPGFAGNLAGFLNGIAPAAGGNGGQSQPQRFSSLVEQLANLEPAAGDQGNQPSGNSGNSNAPAVGQSTCWADAIAAAGAGTVVNMSYDLSPDMAVNDAASCQEGI